MSLIYSNRHNLVQKNLPIKSMPQVQLGTYFIDSYHSYRLTTATTKKEKKKY